MNPVDICHHHSYNIYWKVHSSEINKSHAGSINFQIVHDTIFCGRIISIWYALPNPNCKKYEIANIHSLRSFSSFFIVKLLIDLINFKLSWWLLHIIIRFWMKTFFEHENEANKHNNIKKGLLNLIPFTCLAKLPETIFNYFQKKYHYYLYFSVAYVSNSPFILELLIIKI